MEEDAALTAQIADGGDVLHHTDLIVDVHNRHQHRIVAKGVSQLLQIERAVVARVEIRDAVALVLQLRTGVQDRFMFCGAGNNVTALFLMEAGSPFYGEVIGLSLLHI